MKIYKPIIATPHSIIVSVLSNQLFLSPLSNIICKAATLHAKAIKPIQSNDIADDVDLLGTVARTANKAQNPKGTSV